MRRELDAGAQPAVRMWAFPGLTWLAILFICAVLVIMAIRPGLRLELWLSLALAAVVVTIGASREGSRIRNSSGQTER